MPRAVFAVAACFALVQLATSGVYGIFRDQFDCLACAEHLDWGYMDHPPLSIALLRIVRAVQVHPRTLWLAGLCALLFGRQRARLRCLANACLFAL